MRPSVTHHAIAYRVEREQYNLTVLTRILTNLETGDYLLFQTFVNIAPRPDKAEPVADVVNMVNKTTLADHYRVLADVLNEVRKNDDTSWVCVRIIF